MPLRIGPMVHLGFIAELRPFAEVKGRTRE
jgi:hypothetical protein